MQDAPKAVWSIQYVSVVFFSSLKYNFIAYRSSKVSSRPDCILEIPQLWQSGFNRVYSNCCCSSSFKLEIIKIGQSCHKMYSNNIVNFQESTTILNASTKKSLETYWFTTLHQIILHFKTPRAACFSHLGVVNISFKFIVCLFLLRIFVVPGMFLIFSLFISCSRFFAISGNCLGLFLLYVETYAKCSTLLCF